MSGGLGRRSRRLGAGAAAAVAVVAGWGCSYSTDSALESGSFAEVPTVPPPPTTAAPELDAEDPLDEESRVAIDGIGDVEWGMPVEEAMAAAGRLFVPVTGPTGPCWVAEPRGGPAGVTFMVVEGVVVRADVNGPDTVTLSGAGVGTTVDRLRQLFGSSLSKQTPPSGPGEWWVLRSGAHEDMRVVFETDDDVVTAYRSGRTPEVEWSGCP